MMFVGISTPRPTFQIRRAPLPQHQAPLQIAAAARVRKLAAPEHRPNRRALPPPRLTRRPTVPTPERRRRHCAPPPPPPQLDGTTASTGERRPCAPPRCRWSAKSK
ncbi:Os03g0439601 [Oryza sativa Japonica Group]|uniref:Os03g0439601 protein n=1 Tax=Oryza sativa subsp. japonica TaxID=39947 RepID=A0A0P0W017_ORYSJ|nr:Os03g0439601 [Oryza sativa Japonica Group]